MSTPKKKGESGRTCGGCLIAVGVLIVLAIIGSAMRGGSDDTKTTGSTPPAKANFDGKAYAKKIEKAYVAELGGRAIEQSWRAGEPTWQYYYGGIKAESESWVTMTLAFDGGISENQARDMAKRASLAFFNFVGNDFKKLDMITVYGTVHGTRLDIGTTYRADVPLLNM